jgi:hypothetical protein
LLPPVLALAAIGLQFAIDVPHGPMIVHDDPKPPAKKTTAARTSRVGKQWKPRGEAYTRRLRKSWSSRPLADEPKDRRFADHHEELLRAVARKVEAAAAPSDEPMLISTRVDCHTIRCDFELCAPTTFSAAIVEQLPRFKVGKRSLWHELREVESEQAKQGARACHRYIVDFEVEGADPRNLRLVQPKG